MAKKVKYETVPPQSFIKLNDEQKDAFNAINNHRIIVLSGPAGTGKTMLAVYAALKALAEDKIDKIILTRPAVTTEDFGFMPGDLQEKYTNVYLMPIIDFVNKFGYITHKSFQNLLDEKKIMPLPLAYMRGVTAERSFIILDEAENVLEKQMLMALQRIGKDSTMVISGDVAQCDLSKKEKPGFEKVIKLASRPACTFMKHIELTKIERDDIIQVILDEWLKI